MSMKKILIKAVRNQKHRKEIERMSESEVAELLRILSDKKEVKNHGS